MGVLITNEWIKLSKKKSTWIMLVMLVMMVFGLTWVMRIASSGEMLANDNFSRLTDMTSFLNLFVVIVAASMLAEEFSRGTIKFLLIRPYSRTQILAAKFITAFLYAVVGTVILFVSSFIASNLLLTAESPMNVVEGFNGASALIVALSYAGTNLLLILLYLSLTIFISAVIRSQSLAVGLGIGVLFGSSMINGLLTLAMQKYPWLKWNMFNMLNIKNLLPEAMGESLGTAGMSVSVEGSGALDLYLSYGQMAFSLLIYSLVIYIVTNWLFNKRDVALS
ncbi:ABC transporter permease [Candidatus Enterococcus willemsii]|uniref:ABC transporter permease n=1 Tax=Candidatus Enterococcus willemsii TaxID=1857215 RepID=A0ABQ6Z301_9ENTE|nr:ABC transporter permease [Enterococcus sp. CU12B]KAF1305522.1 hypothetical protein BAU17_07485 [Enterococcus sp. CU12B]